MMKRFSRTPSTQRSNPGSGPRLVSLSLAVLSGLCLLLATERQAHAYIDPGTGLAAINVAAAAIAAASYSFRRRIAALFGRSPKPASSVAVSQPVAPTLSKDDSRSAA